MKFTLYLLKNCVSEWIKLYLNFKLLKNYLVVSNKTKDFLILVKKKKARNEYREIKKMVL